MKLRIKNNSIRYRLTRSDVANLSDSGYIEDRVDFAGKQLIYTIWIENQEQLSVTFVDSTIALSIPKNMIDDLVNTDKVGFENESNGLQLLVEKDFTCLDNVAEDQSDNYPNPLAEKMI